MHETEDRSRKQNLVLSPAEGTEDRIGKPGNQGAGYQPTRESGYGRTCSTIVENVLQIGPRFCKTKPIFRRDKIHVSAVLRKDYEEKARLASQLKQSQTNPIAGLWPEARSTKPQIVDRLAPSTTFRDGPGPGRRAQHEVSSLVVMAAKEGGIIYGLWFTEIGYFEGLYAYPHVQDLTLPCGWRADQLPAQDSVEGAFACQYQNSEAGP